MNGLASDFDHTLYFKEREDKIKQIDKDSIIKFQQEGNLFGICTGRSLKSLMDIVKDEISFDFYILGSGAIILDKNQEVIYKDIIDAEIMYRFSEQFHKEGRIIIHKNNEYYCYKEQFENQPMIKNKDEFDGIYSISLFCGNKENAERLHKIMLRDYPMLDPHLNIRMIDVTNIGVSKGTGIKFVKEYYKLDKIGGIGDYYNDRPMLDGSDITYTFYESPKDLQEEFDVVVDGIYEAIEHLGK